jgi:hypothetical protein
MKNLIKKLIIKILIRKLATKMKMHIESNFNISQHNGKACKCIIVFYGYNNNITCDSLDSAINTLKSLLHIDKKRLINTQNLQNIIL